MGAFRRDKIALECLLSLRMNYCVDNCLLYLRAERFLSFIHAVSILNGQIAVLGKNTLFMYYVALRTIGEPAPVGMVREKVNWHGSDSWDAGGRRAWPSGYEAVLHIPSRRATPSGILRYVNPNKPAQTLRVVCLARR